MTDRISGSAFKQMVLFGAAGITIEREAINDLNVFPVPDGDTGTNMSLTIQTAATELKKNQPVSVSDAASITASALLRGARGNSGVILSLLFRGLSKSVKGLTDMDGAQLAAAMAEGVTTAYGAVMKPAEGTVLTVSRLAAARAVEDYLALELTRMFLFLVSFALVLLLWLLLSRVLDLACKLPVLSTLNHWSGAALGLVKGGLIVFILCWLLRGSLISQEAVEGTVLLRFFCTHTPLSLLAPLLFR